MRKERIPSRYALSGLRTRFFPKSRIGQGLISLAPWLNILVLLMFFLLVFSQIVVQPGYVVDLPAAPFGDGLRPLVTAVVLSLEPTGDGEREEVVFFDDVRFKVGHDKQWDRLKQAMAEFLRQRPGADLTVLADSRVRYGTLVHLITLAKDAGIERINLAHRERMESKADR